jgi:hypothetical protein
MAASVCAIRVYKTWQHPAAGAVEEAAPRHLFTAPARRVKDLGSELKRRLSLDSNPRRFGC